MTTTTFKKTVKQIQAIRLMSQHIEVLLEGGSRSGKTFIAVYALFVRALKYAGSQQLIVRFHQIDMIASLWSQTIPKVCEIAFPGLTLEYNEKKFRVKFPNDSEIWLSGSDDKERIEKLLGQEWDSIYMNEGSQFPFSTYEVLKTRLNPRAGMKPLLIIDYNPPSKTHWGFVLFHKLLNPETKQPVADSSRYAVLKMNPDDNKDNLSEGYLDTLKSMSESKQRRFLRGEYGDDSVNAIWRRDWIVKSRIDKLPNNITRIVVAVDPNVTEDQKVDANTDEAGIITCFKYPTGHMIDGQPDFDYGVMRDDSTPGMSWGSVSCQVFKEVKADKLIAEVNQGGDLVRSYIRNYDREIADRYFDDVRATRGKAVRAEPVADLYRLGKVHHVGEFPELEEELCTWVPGNRSPNRLDALVWGISYLAGLGDAAINVVYDINV